MTSGNPVYPLVEVTPIIHIKPHVDIVKSWIEMLQIALPESLCVEFDHAQNRAHDEKHQNGIQQNVLGQGDATSVCCEIDQLI